MRKIIVVLILISQISICAQEYKFGKVSKEALEEQFHPLDSTADAAYLYRYRRTYYQYMQEKDAFNLVTEIHNRVKIYTKNGFDNANESIFYYKPDKGDDEKITNIKGYTFRLEDNKIVKTKISKKEIFTEKKNKFWSVKKVAMPDIKEGAVVDIKYTISSPYYYRIDDLDIQFNIPVKQLNYTVVIPEFYKFSKKSKGYYMIAPQKEMINDFITTTSRNRTGQNVVQSNAVTSKLDYFSEKNTYKAENIPALKDDEAFVYNADNYRTGIKFELVQTNFIKFGGGLKNYSTSWSSVAKDIYRAASFGGELKKQSYFKDKIEPLLAQTSNDYEKVAAIFQFVKNNVKWNGSYSKYAENGVRKALKESTGNVADVNLMLTSMLRYAGLDANPVLVSSKGNGIPLFPTSTGFDYVVSSVTFSDGKYMVLDATEFYSMPNLLPTRASNWKGRLIKKNGTSKWVSLQSGKPAIEDNTIMVKFDEDLIAQGKIRTKLDNLNALHYRSGYNHVKEESLITNYEGENNIEIEEFKVDNTLKISEPIVRTVSFESEDLVEQIGDKLYIEPLLFLTEHENPFKLDERKFPVEFNAKWKNAFNVLIDIPEGYQVEKLPETLAIGLPDNMGVFKYQVKQMGNKMKTSCILEFKQSIIPAQYYPYLKEFYNQIVKKESEKIVLRKI